MANAEETDFCDIYNLDLNLREKINELQWKTVALEETQKELSETRRCLYESQTVLENERRSSKQLQNHLKAAIEVIRRLEDEKSKNQAENVRLQMNYENAGMERNLLIEQARTAKLENMDLKMKLQDIEANLEGCKLINDSLETSLIELKNSVTRLQTTVNSNVGKLKCEQEKLKNTIDSSVQFGQRVQAILKSSNVVHQRDKKKIEELQKRVDSLAIYETSVPIAAEATDVGNLHLKMESTLKELRSKLENNSIEEKLTLICNELQKMDGSLDKD